MLSVFIIPLCIMYVYASMQFRMWRKNRSWWRRASVAITMITFTEKFSMVISNV